MGDDGYHISSSETNMRHYSFKIMIRRGNARFVTSGGTVHITNFQLSTLHASKNLFQQYIVDVVAKIITERLLWYRTHQKEIRAECYSTLLDHLAAGNSASEVGRVISLYQTKV